MKSINALRNVARTTSAKIGTGIAAVMASGAALASSGSPGAAVAGELSAGKAEMGLIFAAVAVLIGLLVVWAYTKRAAK